MLSAFVNESWLCENALNVFSELQTHPHSSPIECNEIASIEVREKLDAFYRQWQLSWRTFET